MKIVKFLIAFVIMALIVSPCVCLPEEFNEEGTDILEIGDTIIKWLYKLFIMLITMGAIVYFSYIVYIHLSNRDCDVKTGSYVITLAKRIIVAVAVVLAFRYIIGMS